MDHDADASASSPDPGGEVPVGVTDGLGERLRAAREAQGLSLRELARRIGVSASLISQIETGKVQPSVSTLYAFVSELGVSMDAVVFGSNGGDRGSRTGPRAGRVSRGPLIQRSGARDAAEFVSGVRWERLTPTAMPGAEFLYVVYPPGAESSAAGTFQRHGGREWSIVLRGTLHVSVAFEEFVVGPGDSFTYDSTIPHRMANRGDEAVEALWFQLGELPSDSGR